MNISFEKIPQEALSLPNDARIELADRLVESLDSLEESEFQTLWSDESVRRRDEVRKGLVNTIPGDEAVKQVRLAIAKR